LPEDYSANFDHYCTECRSGDHEVCRHKGVMRQARLRSGTRGRLVSPFQAFFGLVGTLHVREFVIN
jgi:hypothetical protein